MARRGPAPFGRVAAVVLALLLVCWLVMEQSRSAFSDTTNEGAYVATDSVVLYDDNSSALFPPVMTADSSLAPYLDLTVRFGSAASTCAAWSTRATVATGSPLSAFLSNHTSWATGVSTGWTPPAVD